MSPSREPPVTTIWSGETRILRARRRCSATAWRSSGSPDLSTVFPGSAAASRHAFRHVAGRITPALPGEGFREIRAFGVVRAGVSAMGSDRGAATVRSGWIRVGAPWLVSR